MLKRPKDKRSHSSSLNQSLSQFNHNQQQNSEIKKMVQLLQAYELICIQRDDYEGAEQVKKKIQQVKRKHIITTNKLIASQQRVNVEQIFLSNEEEIKNFQSFWDQQIQHYIKSLQERQRLFKINQKLQFQKYIRCIKSQEIPRIKYSSRILQKRKHLTNLIKTRSYKEAEVIKNMLKILQAQEQQRWSMKYQELLESKIQKFHKKQVIDLQALKFKLQNLFNQKVKERDDEFQILLKRNRKRLIEISKSSQERLRTMSNSRAINDIKVNLNKSYQK